MTKISIELIKQLRDLTASSMNDCKLALQEADGDLEKARDVLKIKGQTIASGREGKVAAEGMVAINVSTDRKTQVLLECNCQTDFTSNSSEFRNFVFNAAHTLLNRSVNDQAFSIDDVEGARQELVSKTRENIVVRRWWVEQAITPNAKAFNYTHSNDKIGVLLTMLAPTEEVRNSSSFEALGNDIAMQIAAMAPIAVSADRLLPEDIERQKAIFETQLKELNKPPASWAKIMEGKTRKWFQEVCLLDQEAVMMPKITIQQMIDKACKGTTIVSFVRCQVGEGIETQQKDFAAEVAQLTGAS